MSANARRGEIDAVLDGQSYRLCLTLGALAELEHAFAADDLSALVERFSTGRLSAGDLMKIIGAGLRGGGHDLRDEDVGAMQAEGGAAGFADIATRLLAATFGGGETPPKTAPSPSRASPEPPLPRSRGGEEGSQAGAAPNP